jgi:hypothetical protein
MLERFIKWESSGFDMHRGTEFNKLIDQGFICLN